jgi:hypothetical protein
MNVMSDNPHGSTTLQLALNIQENVEEYLRTKDRTALVNALKDQFLAQRHSSATATEAARELAARVLIGRIPRMSDNMLIRAISELAKIGDIDTQAILTGSVGGRGPLFALSQTINTAQPGNNPEITGLSNNPADSSVKHVGNVLEAIEHLSSYLRQKGAKEPDIIEAEVIEDD